MKSFTIFDVQSNLGQDAVFNLMQNKFQDFSWRRGESEMQGLYVSGSSPDGIHVKIWLSDSPTSLTVSFDDAWSNFADAENLKQKFLNEISLEIIPALGILLKVTER